MYNKSQSLCMSILETWSNTYLTEILLLLAPKFLDFPTQKVDGAKDDKGFTNRNKHAISTQIGKQPAQAHKVDSDGLWLVP